MKSHVGSFKNEASKWTAKDDFVLMMLVGKQTYRSIGLLLGRTRNSVQQRASYKGYSARDGWRIDRETRARQLQSLKDEMLAAGEEDLIAYLEVPDEEPPPVPAKSRSREYQREYFRKYRSAEARRRD